MSSVSPLSREITQGRIDAYAAASGDHNPIHINEAFARGTQFGGTIAHGMLVLATIGDLMQTAHGEAWTRTGKLKVRFKAPTRSGETVTASATLASEADDIADYAVQCVTASGEIVIEGRASVSLAHE